METFGDGVEPRMNRWMGGTVLMGAALLLFFFAFGTASVQGASIIAPEWGWPGQPGSGASHGKTSTWGQLFNLLPGVPYTYTLEYSPGRDWGWYPGGGRTTPLAGELTFTRIGGRDEIRFSFSVDGVKGSGKAPYDAHALAGAVVLAALTSDEPISPEGLRLLLAPFHWVQWYDLFASSNFRNGTVWHVSQHPPYRFTATSTAQRWTYKGRLTLGRDVVMDLVLNVHEPLPREIVVYDGRDRYKAAGQSGDAAPRR